MEPVWDNVTWKEFVHMSFDELADDDGDDVDDDEDNDDIVVGDSSEN